MSTIGNQGQSVKTLWKNTMQHHDSREKSKVLYYDGQTFLLKQITDSYRNVVWKKLVREKYWNVKQNRSSAAVCLASVSEDFYGTLMTLCSCFRRISFCSIICHSSKCHTWTWKFFININRNFYLSSYFSLTLPGLIVREAPRPRSRL